MTTLDILKKARALISEPARWCQRASAMTARGMAVRATSRAAVVWCAVGAIRRSGRNAHNVREALDSLNLPSIPHWNDAPRRTHAQVLRRFDAAIRRLEKQEAAK